jgi:hypothetical protein
VQALPWHHHVWQQRDQAPKRASLLAGRVGLLVYIFYNSRVLNRLHSPVVQEDWAAMLEWLDSIPLTAAERTALGEAQGDEEVVDMSMIE